MNNITLAEFLGWQDCYKILTEIKQQAKKFELKKYYLKLKGEYIKFICKDICNSYLIFRIEERFYFLGCDDNVKYKFQTQFTDEEIKNIKLPEPLTIDMFDKIEVE